ncbi:MAG: prephenate dehydrogenase [Candidatus Omnitrophica bacterium]|nr:prephenate dehydrogenase [Candidatus Omnitrophota bacterium]
MRLFNKVGIVGVGLIGGSLALGIKKYKLARKILGVSRHKESIARAKHLGVVDAGSINLNIIKDADLIVLATPVMQLIEILPKIFKLAKKGAVIIDVASTKNNVIQVANKFTDKDKIFVGCHPLAGSEKRGVVNASPDLFKNSLCIIVATKIKNASVLERIKKLWHALGALTLELSAREHDKILAYISHLPHIAAYSLMRVIPIQYLKFSAQGLKDTTRIASSEPRLWEEIFLTNRQEIIPLIKKYEYSLRYFKSLLVKKDARRLRTFLKASKYRRDKIL